VIPPPIAAEPEVDGTPTESENITYTYAKNRLYYLVRNDILFQEVQKVAFKKGKTSFRVYYLRPNNGSLFDFKEQKDGKISLTFPAVNGEEIDYKPSPKLDDHLLKAFVKRATEAGISFEAAPVLHSIKGGQPTSAA
jgi:hypothetical protein